MPKIAYVCENCWENNSEASCHPCRDELRVTPDGRWMCDSCYEYDPDHEDDENRTPWNELPIPPEFRMLDKAGQKDAEIERLSKLYRAASEELVEQGKLITDLADVINEMYDSKPSQAMRSFWDAWRRCPDLIHRAKEETK